jgi:hypothetical protein
VYLLMVILWAVCTVLVFAYEWEVRHVSVIHALTTAAIVAFVLSKMLERYKPDFGRELLGLIVMTFPIPVAIYLTRNLFGTMQALILCVCLAPSLLVADVRTALQGWLGRYLLTVVLLFETPFWVGQFFATTGFSMLQSHSKAARIYESALSIYPWESLYVAGWLNDLGLIYLLQGRYAEGEPLLKRSLTIQEKFDGPFIYNPVGDGIANLLNNLAELYRTQSRYAEAEPIAQRALAIREQPWHLALRGADHNLAVAKSLSTLALVYYDQGRYSDAEPLMERALVNHEKETRAGPNSVMQSLYNLALLYHAQGPYLCT